MKSNWLKALPNIFINLRKEIILRYLFVFIMSLFPFHIYAQPIFILKETKDVYYEEVTTASRSNLIRFSVDYTNDQGTSGSLRSSCWGSFDEMKNASDADGLGFYQETFNDGVMSLNSSATTLNFISGKGSVNALTYMKALSGFSDETWTLYCTVVSNAASKVAFRPSELTYTIINLIASSVAFPYIIAPQIVNLKTCLPNDVVEASVPLTVGFTGYLGKGKRMELTVKSNDLPNGFGVYVDEVNILNSSSHVVEMPSNQKEKPIESHLKGNCPDTAGEYIWSAEYIYTIQ